MELGGIERSLIGLLKEIDYTKHDVDLFLVKHEGELLADIPKQVHVLPEEPAACVFGISLKELFVKLRWKYGLVRLIGTLRTRTEQILLQRKLSGEYTSQYVYPKMMKCFKIQPREYDLAISFSWPAYYILSNVKARKKVGWIHTDYTKIYPDKKVDLNMWEQLDQIVGVSEDCVRTFLKVFPSLRKKTLVIENVLDCENIIKKSRLEEIKFNAGYINLLSIGRFCEAKNFDNVPEICSLINKQGLRVRWYLIGFGGDEKIIRSKIEEFQMQEQVIILGKKENPYPYIKGCDIYVQPSRFEGKAVTVREAQVLHKPVVITDFANAKSQVSNGYDGWIVSMENSKCAMEIVEFLKNANLQQKLIENTKISDYSNRQEVEKVYQLAGEE